MNQYADIVFFNGPIYTVESDSPQVEAVAVKGERLQAVGSWNEIQKLIGAQTRQYDLQGRMLCPGLIESHGHFQGMGRLRSILNLQGKSQHEILQMVKAKAQTLAPGQWIIGRGWDQNHWPDKKFPHKKSLDEVAPHHPVYLTRIDGHAAWVNTPAWEAAVSARQKENLEIHADPKGGQIVRDEQGTDTGVLLDYAMEWVSVVIPPYSLEQKVEFLKLAQAECLSLGITSFHDAGSDEDILPAYDWLKKKGELKLRLYVMLMGNNPRLLKRYYEQGPVLDKHLTIRAIKLYADGALGSCGALMFAPYSHARDLKDPCGLELLGEEEIFELAKEARRAGFQVCTHAIGDRANHLVLNAYERALEAKNQDERFRVEHAQLLAPADLPRFKKLNVIASMQATHCTSDMEWIDDKIGKKRAQEEGYLWRDLLDSGAHLCNGSDVPIEHANPLWGFYSSISRQNHQGMPLEGWHPEQRMKRTEALHSFTLAGAYASFTENEKGSLKVGKLADLVILSQNIMEISVEKILETTVLATMVGGLFEFER